MTADWFDLGQRLYAARSGRPVARLAGSPARPGRHPVAVRARQRGGTVSVTASAGGPDGRAAGAAALDLLCGLGVRITEPSGAALVWDAPGTLPALTSLARSAGRDGAHADVAAHLAWWADRADFPGTTAVVGLPAACQSRWITGTSPAAERSAATWRSWLGITDDGCAGMLGMLARLQEGTPLSLLDAIEADDDNSWAQAQREHAEQRDWRLPDSVGRAAAGLRSRCDAADLYAAALLSDPQWRLRALHTGHVVTGRADVPAGARRSVTVTCDRMDARVRAGSDIAGWAGGPAGPGRDRFTGSVTGAEVRGGLLTLDIGAVGGTVPAPGSRVTLLPAPPRPATLAEGRRRVSRLYATRTSWLATGRPPAPARRDVPLEVLVAAAPDEPGD